MSKYLCTFPGKFGDILWSLPTAKYIAEKVVGQPVDFAVMPYYGSLLPLIQEQSYIDRAFIIPDWLRTHSNYGDQPWEAPVPKAHLGVIPPRESGHPFQYVLEEYERVWHLGYRCHPGAPFGNPDISLMEFVAYQQGITFSEPMIPFLSVKEAKPEKPGRFVVVALNEQYHEQKEEFLRAYVLANKKPTWLAICIASEKSYGNISWERAAGLLANKDCLAYVGDRSANWVIANGLGKQCITFEPHPSRHASGHLGKVFGCPGGKEIALPFNMPAAVAGQTAAAMVRKMVEEKYDVASA